MENGDIKIWASSIIGDLPRMMGHQNSDTGIIIPRIPERLRLGESDLYEPRIISFGPYHHGKPRLQAMEKYKWRYLQAILVRCDDIENALEHYINIMKEQETKIRSWYPDYFDINSSEEFVKMMLLDGCFVVEYLLRSYEQVDDEELRSMVWIHGEVHYDILLLENQIPFFILNKIFDYFPDTHSHSLTDLAILYLKSQTKPRFDLPPPESVHHLLHLYHSFRLFTPNVEGDSTTNTAEVSDIPSATVLREAGIKFVREEQEGSILDVTFSNGKMKIPPLLIDADFKSRLRNLVIFEQFYPNFSSPKSFSVFVDFINCLVTTPEDVALLYQKEIIHTSYGKKYAAGLLGQLNRGTTVRPDQYYLAPMYLEVNKYRQNRKHKWCASLIHDYVSTPWKVLGIVVGGFLLVLTLLQTIFSGISTF